MAGQGLRFVITNSRCVINGNAYSGIPIFFDELGVVAPVSDYLVHLVYQKRKPSTTARTYAIHLQKFLKHIAAIGVSWTDVVDKVLIEWRDGLLDQRGLAPGTVHAYLSTVFGFYCWAQRTSRVRHVVNLYDHPDDRGGDGQGPAYQISACPSRRPGRFHWPYLPDVRGQRVRHTPTNEEIERIHLAVFRTKTGQRDSLLLSFYEECCLRRAEALAVKVGDIPSWENIDAAQSNNTVFSLQILGKGAEMRSVDVLPELMARAREHIEEDRAAVVRRARRRNPAYCEPDSLFLAHTTAARLNQDQDHVSRRISSLMRSLGIENASGHRVRARGLTTLVEAHDGVDASDRPLPAEQVLWKAAQVAGHKHWRSLRPYLNMVRSARHATPVDELIRMKTRMQLLERENAELKSKLQGSAPDSRSSRP